MGTNEDLATFIDDLKQSGVDVVGEIHATPDGVVFETLKTAIKYSERHKKVLVRISGTVCNWRAQNKEQPTPTPSVGS
jgi:hypothetical protein